MTHDVMVQAREVEKFYGDFQALHEVSMDVRPGEVAIPLSPTRALELAKELIEPAVRSIKNSQWGSGWTG